MNKSPFYIRYQRQLALPGFGEEAQQKLNKARVLVIGAGGLGCPVLQYLCAVGIGTIGIIDDDMVDLSNLQRQVLYKTEDVGLFKVDVAAVYLKEQNPLVHVDVYNERLTVINALDIIKHYDVIVDGTDNFSTKYIVNDSCVLLHKPLVFGAISGYEGQIAVFDNAITNLDRCVNYRDAFPSFAAEDEAPNCIAAGVLGVLPGIIGSMMAAEVIKLVTGIGEVLRGVMMVYNLLNQQLYKMQITAAGGTAKYIPKNEDELRQHDYGVNCIEEDIEISAEVFNQLLKKDDAVVVDVRSSTEEPVVTAFDYFKIPFEQIDDVVHQFKSKSIILFCASGKRSLAAAKYLRQRDVNIKVYSLKGGIINSKIPI